MSYPIDDGAGGNMESGRGTLLKTIINLNLKIEKMQRLV